jgi:hypothetical protein
MITISPSMSKKKEHLISPYIQIPENVDSFDFDAIVFDECFILKNISGYIFRRFLMTTSLEINEEQLTKFIGLICENYNRNHFHNFQHAVNILQMTYKLLLETNLIGKLKPNIVFGILIAAISHDVDHPGNTNSYEINAVTKYAKLYNDSSVLENHHCTLTFELLEHTCLINAFKGDEFREFRKTIIMGILGTDMSKHNDCINRLTTFDFTKETFTIEQQYFITSAILHCADLSNSIKNFEISFEWSKRISLEFYEQTVKEELEGLPSLSFMKVHDNLAMCINEVSFITNVSIPMWKLIKSKFEKLGFLLDKCQSTLEKWKEIESQYISENDINSLNY